MAQPNIEKTGEAKLDARTRKEQAPSRIETRLDKEPVHLLYKKESPEQTRRRIEEDLAVDRITSFGRHRICVLHDDMGKAVEVGEGGFGKVAETEFPEEKAGSDFVAENFHGSTGAQEDPYHGHHELARLIIDWHEGLVRDKKTFLENPTTENLKAIQRDQEGIVSFFSALVKIEKIDRDRTLQILQQVESEKVGLVNLIGDAYDPVEIADDQVEEGMRRKTGTELGREINAIKNRLNVLSENLVGNAEQILELQDELLKHWSAAYYLDPGEREIFYQYKEPVLSNSVIKFAPELSRRDQSSEAPAFKRSEIEKLWLREWSNLTKMRDVKGVPQLLGAKLLKSSTIKLEPISSAPPKEDKVAYAAWRNERKKIERSRVIDAVRPVFLMEKAPGKDLASILKDGGKLPPEDVLHIVKEVARILGEAHKRDIVYRDLKPANIIFDAETKEVNIIDWGIAAQIDERTEALKKIFNDRLLEAKSLIDDMFDKTDLKSSNYSTLEPDKLISALNNKFLSDYWSDAKTNRKYADYLEQNSDEVLKKDEKDSFLDYIEVKIKISRGEVKFDQGKINDASELIDDFLEAGMEPKGIMRQIKLIYDSAPEFRNLPPEQKFLEQQRIYEILVQKTGGKQKHEIEALFKGLGTISGLVRGTPVFMAPEQMQGYGYDTRVDNFSLGVLGFHLLVGNKVRNLFNDLRGAAIAASHNKIIKEEYRSVDTYEGEDERRVVELLNRMADPTVSTRIQTMKEIEQQAGALLAA
ncbi:MAG: hypothetical protein ABID45_01905 [Patescibacteria group bacterium]